MGVMWVIKEAPPKNNPHIMTQRSSTGARASHSCTTHKFTPSPPGVGTEAAVWVQDEVVTSRQMEHSETEKDSESLCSFPDQIPRT